MTTQQFNEDDIPPTPFEIEAARHERTLAQNERRERMRLRRANAAKGHDEPRDGTTLHVQLDGSISRRRRSGIHFERGQRVAVKVIDESEDEVLARQRAGERVVSVYGAERIIEDTSLHVFDQPAVPADLDELRQRNLALEEELRVSRAESAELAAKMRAARQSAKDPGDGRPSRLPAAREAVKGESAPSAEFGAPPATATK